MNNIIGITERGDAAFDLNWLPWVQSGKPAILITKSPQLLHDILSREDKAKKFNVIIHCTITGWGGTELEPFVPFYFITLDGYYKLCDYYSPERIVLRIDPVIPTLMGRQAAKNVLEEAQKNVKTRVRISFLDLYPHVIERLKKINFSPWIPWTSFHAPLELRKQAWEELGKPEICGEPGFQCTGCVSEIDCNIFNIESIDPSRSQRQYCACLANKKELLKNKSQCPHKCEYCYWKGD